MAAIANNTHPSLPAARVAEAMHHGIVTLPPHCSLREVATEMVVNHVHCVVIEGLARGADRDGERLVWGILSDMDLMRAIASGQLGVDAGELAATEIITVDPRETIERVAALMAEHDVAHVIVVSHETGEPIGVVSTLDVAAELAA